MENSDVTEIFGIDLGNTTVIVARIRLGGKKKKRLGSNWAGTGAVAGAGVGVVGGFKSKSQSKNPKQKKIALPSQQQFSERIAPNIRSRTKTRRGRSASVQHGTAGQGETWGGGGGGRDNQQQRIKQPTNQTNQTTNHSNQSSRQPRNQPTNRPTNQPKPEQTARPSFVRQLIAMIVYNIPAIYVPVAIISLVHPFASLSYYMCRFFSRAYPIVTHRIACHCYVLLSHRMPLLSYRKLHRYCCHYYGIWRHTGPSGWVCSKPTQPKIVTRKKKRKTNK